jgi:hypothetical protein
MSLKEGSMRLRGFSRVVTATTITAGLVLLAANPAAAHDSTVVVPGGYGQVVRQHTTIRACDTVTDDVVIRVDYQTSSGARGSVGGPDGAAGCRQESLVTGAVTRWRVCADASCSPWRQP